MVTKGQRGRAKSKVPPPPHRPRHDPFVSHLDLSRAPYVLYGVKYIDLVSLGAFATTPATARPLWPFGPLGVFVPFDPLAI